MTRYLEAFRKQQLHILSDTNCLECAESTSLNDDPETQKLELNIITNIDKTNGLTTQWFKNTPTV